MHTASNAPTRLLSHIAGRSGLSAVNPRKAAIGSMAMAATRPGDSEAIERSVEYLRPEPGLHCVQSGLSLGDRDADWSPTREAVDTNVASRTHRRQCTSWIPLGG